MKFLIPIADRATLEDIKGSFTRFRKEDLRTDKVEFEFFNTSIELGSYHRTIAIKTSETPQGLFVEFSVPKYAKGNNVEMIYPHQLPDIIAQLYVELCNHLNAELPHFSAWPIYKLDICYNWILKNKAQATYAMDFLRRIDFPRKKKYVYDTSVMHLGTAYTLKFYLKGAEFVVHDFKKIEISRAIYLQSIADKVVRFEVSLKRVYLQEQFLIEKVYLEDVANDYAIEEMLKNYLEKKVFAYVNPESMSDETIKQILFENFSKQKATRLYQFYKDFYFNDEMKSMFLNGGLDRSTIYRYKKDLERSGIGVSAEKAPDVVNILEQLIIPSPHARYDLIDYF